MKITYSDPNNVVQLTRWVGDPFGVGVHRPSRSIASKYTISTCIVKKKTRKECTWGLEARRLEPVAHLPIFRRRWVLWCPSSSLETHR